MAVLPSAAARQRPTDNRASTYSALTKRETLDKNIDRLTVICRVDTSETVTRPYQRIRYEEDLVADRSPNTSEIDSLITSCRHSKCRSAHPHARGGQANQYVGPPQFIRSVVVSYQ